MHRLRCDRKQPCQSCIRLGQASACSYPFPQLSRSAHNTVEQTAFQQRIDHLEMLVRTLAESQQAKAPPTPASTATSEISTVAHENDPPSRDFGRMHLEKNAASYVESDHWRAILDEIDDLKGMASGEAERLQESLDDEAQRLPGTDLFFLPTDPITKPEIVAAIPSRAVLDSIIARYFQTADMPVTLIIHRRVFFKQYERFWEAPLESSYMWLTTLFGMMFLMAYLALFVNAGDNTLDQTTVQEYQIIVATAREKMIQCLRLGNYMRGTPHTIEALLAFLQTEFVQGEDAQQGNWQLIGTIIRVALKMGYHRDGSHFPEMSPFEAEMRRRTWYILMQFDIASASQAGLPRAIKETQCDTAEPRSLLDDDFDDESTVLPPGRPPNEHTLAQFLIYKSRVVMVYGMICDFTTSSRQRDYNEALKLDSLLRNAYLQKPPILDLKPIHRSIMDGTDLITRRLYIALTYHHAQMTLHRKFMILAKTNDKYTASHTTCMQAALATSELRAELAEHTQPGRMLYLDRWKIFALTQAEFLLATIILCYNLNDDVVNGRLGKTRLCTPESMEKTMGALRVARDIWSKQQDTSKEAHTAVKAIGAVLSKAEGTLASVAPPVTSSWDISKTDPAFEVSLNSAGLYSTQPAPQSFPFENAMFDSQQNPSDVSWNEFFDLDRTWEEWLQF